MPKSTHPPNLKFVPGEEPPHIDGDVYNICERVREISQNLRIWPAHQDDERNFVITELCKDGQERFVFACDALDQRILNKLMYLQGVPFEKRFAEAEKMEQKMKDEDKEDELDQLYEEMGRPMLTELEKNGFVTRSTIHPKLGVIAPRRAR